MHGHRESVFNNNCLKVPRNPRSDHPLPVYEQKLLNQLNNQTTKTIQDMKAKGALDTTTVKSFIDFYDSIPEYHDVNHLSNKDFYKKLQNLKEKQQSYCEYLRNQIRFDNRDTEWIEDYKNLSIHDKPTAAKKIKPTIKPFCATPQLSKPGISKIAEDIESLNLSDKEIFKPPSRRSVRIETPSEKYLTPNFTPEPHLRPKSRANLSSADSKPMYNEWDDLNFEDFRELSSNNSPLAMETKSAPSTPTKIKKNVEKMSVECDGITIPKPFQMTVRDEENKIVDELFLKVNKPKEDKPEMFKAHDVPIESQIPLFDKIMADQEIRSHIVKEKRKAALQAQMRPFSFTRRDEEIQALTKRLSKSVPCIYYDKPPLKIKKFKAKPIPRNLFSNYVYKKMHEDEFYRALQKKIRAEEMLRAASLPPSMAKREKSQPKFDVCPRSYRDLQPDEKEAPKKSKKIPNYSAYHDKMEREFEELKNEFISTSPRPYKLKASKRSEKKGKKKYYRNFSASSKSSSDTGTTSSLDIPSVNRSNLAAVLRISSAKKRLEMEMISKLEEAKLKEEARWREKLMRKKPVWQTLAYSHEEDLATRLQMRREEEKLRGEEHRLRMQLMLGRVNQQPTLFERQSQVKFPKTREELADELYRNFGNKKSPKFKLSDLRCLDMKDEAIQAMLDEYHGSGSISRSNSKESESNEEKEKCDCFSDENDKLN